LGKKTSESGLVELKLRESGEVRELPLSEAADAVCELIREMLEEG
jgi:hypothetical protein